MPRWSTVMQGNSAQYGNRNMTAVRNSFLDEDQIKAKQREATGQSGLNEAHGEQKWMFCTEWVRWVKFRSQESTLYCELFASTNHSPGERQGYKARGDRVRPQQTLKIL